MKNNSANDTLFELIYYKDLVGELKKELMHVNHDEDKLSDISDTFRKQKDILDSIDDEKLINQIKSGNLIPADLKVSKKLLKEKKLYKKHEEEIDYIINEDYDAYNEYQNKKSTKRSTIFGLTGVAAIIGLLFYSISGETERNKKEETETTSIVKDATTEEIEPKNDKTTEIINNITESISEGSTEKATEVKIVTIKEQPEKDKTVKEEKNDIKKETSIDKKHEKENIDDKKQEQNKNREQETKEKKTEPKQEDNNKKEDNKEKTNTKEKAEKENEYKEPSTVVIDNLKDDNKDYVVDNINKDKDTKLPSTDKAEGNDEVTHDMTTGTTENENKNKNNENIELPPIDNNVEGDDKGIEFDITGSSNIGKKLTLSRGRL